MYTFKIKLAEKNINVECLYPSTEKFCSEYLSENEETDIYVSVTPSDIETEREKSDREQRLEGLVPHEYSPAYLETLALYRKIADALIDHNTILFHGSSLAIDGKGYIFTAKSGTGKSTHTRLWREVFGERVVMVNDDKPLIKITDNGAFVFGTPWCGKHNLGSNISVPLCGIVSLERSEKNRIREIDSKSIFPKILSQTYRTNNPLGLQKTLSLIDKLLIFVRVYKLGCNMNKDAAIVAYEGIIGDKK